MNYVPSCPLQTRGGRAIYIAIARRPGYSAGPGDADARSPNPSRAAKRDPRLNRTRRSVVVIHSSRIGARHVTLRRDARRPPRFSPRRVGHVHFFGVGRSGFANHSRPSARSLWVCTPHGARGHVAGVSVTAERGVGTRKSNRRVWRHGIRDVSMCRMATSTLSAKRENRPIARYAN